MSAIQDQIDQLQAQLQQLQQQLAAATADSLAPNYLTLDAEGHVSANFSGYVSAKGMSFPEGNSGSKLDPKVINEIQWLDANGILREAIQGYLDTLEPAHILELDSAADLRDTASLLLSTREGGAIGMSSVTMTVADSAGGNAVATILDSANNSSYPQLPSAHELIIDDNAGALYQTGLVNVAAGGFATATFATPRNWAGAAVPLGGLAGSVLTGPASVTWSYGFAAPNTFRITLSNLAAVAQTFGWAGVILGH